MDIAKRIDVNATRVLGAPRFEKSSLSAEWFDYCNYGYCSFGGWYLEFMFV